MLLGMFQGVALMFSPGWGYFHVVPPGLSIWLATLVHQGCHVVQRLI